MRKLGFIFIIISLLSVAGEIFAVSLPTCRWFFAISREMSWCRIHSSVFQGLGIDSLASSGEILWFGWLSVMILFSLGCLLVIRSYRKKRVDPLSLQRLERFKNIKRGYYSLNIILFLVLVAGLDQLIVGKRALVVKDGEKWYFPAFVEKEYKNKEFGIGGESANAPVNYRSLKVDFEKNGRGRVWMPLVPYDPTGDTLPAQSKRLTLEGDHWYEVSHGPRYSGLAVVYYKENPIQIHTRYTIRNGKKSGPVEGWDVKGNSCYYAEFIGNQLSNERYYGSGTKEAYLQLAEESLKAIKYHPSPPILEGGHYLGTTTQGYDVLAYLYGGLQVNLKAAMIFMPIVYAIGILIGMLMGYLGGWFDFVVQRLIEIFSNMPFLFVVIILSNMVPDSFKGLPVILTILALFGWMGISSLMRTAAYRDKERDYVSAAKVMGAGTPRIIFYHMLPNTLSMVVTMIPFSISGLVFALTSLDYLGFGLPPEYASWGRLLSDGLSNLAAPWLVTSTFIVLVSLLVLITFIGEAVREAFEPRTYTYYR